MSDHEAETRAMIVPKVVASTPPVSSPTTASASDESERTKTTLAQEAAVENTDLPDGLIGRAWERLAPSPPELGRDMPWMPEGDLRAATLDSDPGFRHVMGAVDRQEDFLRRQTEFLEEQLRTFERYMDESHESARSAWRWSLASVVVASLSLLVAGVTLLEQFGAFG